MVNRLVKASKSLHFQRNSGSLVVPYTHLGVTNFEKGVPAEKVRELSPEEVNWKFWTSSSAFYPLKNTWGLNYVPKGESWVVERFGKFSREVGTGVHFLLPFVEKVKAVKSTNPVSIGVNIRSATTKDGSKVDAYVVGLFRVSRPSVSTYYVSETGKSDSEAALVENIQSFMVSALREVNFTQKQIPLAEAKSITDKLVAFLNSKLKDGGIEVDSFDLRGVFAVEEQVLDKIRALDPPLPSADYPLHGLSNDYWADVLTPPFFEKRKFGSEKEARTPAATSLEWSIPSPPDYHHFNMVPRMIAPLPAEGQVAKAAH